MSMRRTLAVLALIVTASSLPGQQASFEQQLSPTAIDEFVAELFEDYEPPAAAYAVDIYQLLVETTHPSGVATPVRVQLFVPRTGEAAPRGSYLFAPGSTGLINPCRPSREHEAGIHWGLYRAHVLSLAGQGFVGILPDYMGFEDWDLLQPYFHAESEARLLVDVTVAVHDFLSGGIEGARIDGGLSGLTRVG
ncbi:MAG: hypothetical protein ACOC7V_16900, partial [Spirochaetota bacterium]